MNHKLTLPVSEEVVLHSQGTLRSHPRSGWKPGHHYLTNKRLLFSQPTGILFETPLSNIINITIEKQKFVLGTKNVIGISHVHTKTGRTSKIWFIPGALEIWIKKIYEMTLLKIDEETLYKIADELDSGSRDILWYLWQKKHAKIDELAEVIAAPNHMDVLLRIRNIINPTAEKITGNSILAFEKSKVDYETGERILFSWWIIGERQLTRMQERETFIDIFDEDDHINVIMNLVDVQEKDVFLKVEGNKLTVSDNTIENPLYEEIHLPAEVDPREVNKTYKNGILVVRLEKISKECNHQEGPTALAGL